MPVFSQKLRGICIKRQTHRIWVRERQVAEHGTIIIGAGQAGYQTAAQLRVKGYTAPITLIGDEAHIPYQQPPLSKAYLKGELDGDRLPFRPENFYGDKDIALRLNERVEAIDPAAKTVTTAHETLPYDTLVIATGGTPRQIPVPDALADKTFILKTRDDADALRQALSGAHRVAIVGAGFIGLEVAATAAQAGKAVTVYEMQNRILARVASPAVSAALEARHATAGVDIRLNEGVDFEQLEADVVLLGIGGMPVQELAESAGLICDGGIAVDGHMRTSDPSIFAAGDCAKSPTPFWSEAIRLESVQNAIDQANLIAEQLTGNTNAQAYHAVPWFWSDQYEVKYQLAGLIPSDTSRVQAGEGTDGLAIYHFKDDALVACETLGNGAEHMSARRLLEQGNIPVSEADLAEHESLKAVFKARR
jgi:3-phenylpropionate/trans-cinnamate dioxygenase ferredoxin reductase component